MHRVSVTTGTRIWSKSYCAEKLGLLLFLCADKENKRAANIAKNAAHWKVKAPKNKHLQHAFHRLRAVYDPLHLNHMEKLRADKKRSTVHPA